MANDWRTVLTSDERNELAKIESELSEVIETIRAAKRRIHKLTQKGPSYLQERREQFPEVIDLKEKIPSFQEKRTLLQGLRYKIQNRASKRIKAQSHQAKEGLAA